MSLRCSVFGIPSAVVSWWRGERLVANHSRLVHEWEEQFYRVVEHRANTHQVSESEGAFNQPLLTANLFTAATGIIRGEGENRQKRSTLQVDVGNVCVFMVKKNR